MIKSLVCSREGLDDRPMTPTEGSLATPGPLCFYPFFSWSCRCYLGALVVSFLLIQSHRLASLAAFERAMIALHWALPQVSMSSSSLVVYLPTKPVSIGHFLDFQPCCSALVDSSARVLKGLPFIWLFHFILPGAGAQPDLCCRQCKGRTTKAWHLVWD